MNQKNFFYISCSVWYAIWEFSIKRKVTAVICSQSSQFRHCENKASNQKSLLYLFKNKFIMFVSFPFSNHVNTSKKIKEKSSLKKLVGWITRSPFREGFKYLVIVLCYVSLQIDNESYNEKGGSADCNWHVIVHNW